MRKKKISELPLAESLVGLHTIGVDKSNNSVKVGLEFVVAGALRALFVARGAVWNEKTGFYELNGLLDITEREMLTIYQQTGFIYNPPYNYFLNAQSSMNLVSFRTNFQMVINTPQAFPYLVTAQNIEVYNPGLDIYEYKAADGYILYSSPKLRSINGVIDCVNAKNIHSTYNVPKLESIKLKNLKINFNLFSGASLSYESVMYIINNAANTIPIILTLHANATARLTPEDIALASSKNITIA